MNNDLVLLDPSEVPSSSETRLAAIGLGDNETVFARLKNAGLSRRPPIPVSARHTTLTDGSLELCWTRRARGQWRWIDGSDVALVEESERYAVCYGAVDNPFLEWALDEPRFTLTQSERLALIADYGPGNIWVRQVGTYARSPALLLHSIRLASEAKMAEPISFPSTTQNFGLPLLFAGQAQKEFFVNQSFAIIDAVLQQTVTASLATPPDDDSDGTCYRITEGARGAWEGRDDAIAIRVGTAWTFIQPRQGMAIFDNAEHVSLRFGPDWRKAVEPQTARGGSVIDVEARQMLAELIESLRVSGIYSNPGTT